VRLRGNLPERAAGAGRQDLRCSADQLRLSKTGSRKGGKTARE
jgi:hypothetical protein